MDKYLSKVNNEVNIEQKKLAVRLPFITQTIALAVVPFEEILSFEFGGILRIINLITIFFAIIAERLTKIKMHSATAWLLMFVFLAAISYLWCFNTGLYFDRMLTYGMYLILSLVLGSLSPTSKEKEYMLRGLFVGGVVASVLILMTSTSSMMDDRATLVMLGRTVNPNRLSFSFVLSVNYSIYILFNRRTKSHIKNIVLILTTVVLVAGIIATGSRSSVIVLLCCVFFLVCKGQFGKNTKLKRAWLVLLLLLVVFLVYNVFILGSEFGERFTIDNLTGKGEYGYANRDKIWQAAITQIKEKPILGYGNGASPYAIAELYTFYSTHNSYLMILLEFGVVGLIICAAMFVSLYKRYKRQKNALYCSFIVCVLIDTIFIEGFSAKVFWAVMLLLLICQENEGKNQDEQK